MILFSWHFLIFWVGKVSSLYKMLLSHDKRPHISWRKCISLVLLWQESEKLTSDAGSCPCNVSMIYDAMSPWTVEPAHGIALWDATGTTALQDATDATAVPLDPSRQSHYPNWRTVRGKAAQLSWGQREWWRGGNSELRQEAILLLQSGIFSRPLAYCSTDFSWEPALWLMIDALTGEGPAGAKKNLANFM